MYVIWFDVYLFRDLVGTESFNDLVLIAKTHQISIYLFNPKELWEEGQKIRRWIQTIQLKYPELIGGYCTSMIGHITIQQMSEVVLRRRENIKLGQIIVYQRKLDDVKLQQRTEAVRFNSKYNYVIEKMTQRHLRSLCDFLVKKCFRNNEYYLISSIIDPAILFQYECIYRFSRDPKQ